jgi:hypothetical protein
LSGELALGPPESVPVPNPTIPLGKASKTDIPTSLRSPARLRSLGESIAAAAGDGRGEAVSSCR